MKKIIFASICILLSLAMLLSLGGCAASVSAADLMDGITPDTVSGRDADETFLTAQMELALKLFQGAAGETPEENVLISPLSIQMALAMTANGADGQTLQEMEALLGGGIPLETLNEYLYAYRNALPSGEGCTLAMANGIWYRDAENRLTVKPEFLQTNADYYGAQIRKAPFDDTTLAEINQWVSEQTGGIVDGILEEINPNAVMYLLSAMMFDGQWQTPFGGISDGTFTSAGGDVRAVEMLHGSEAKYLEDEKATGFIKDYQGGRYSFAALLPNPGVALSDYIAGLDAGSLLHTLSNPRNTTVSVALPKFRSDYTLTMNDLLSDLGMPTGFDHEAADFSKMGHSPNGNLYIGEVLHKTSVTVDQAGTTAGATTIVEMNLFTAAIPLSVCLDRPFVYLILDNATNLPIFIGTVLDTGSPEASEPDHSHQTADTPQTVPEPVSGYCGNTLTTVHADGRDCTFEGSDSVALTDILINLAYDPMKVCRCMTEFTVDTELGCEDGYGINLTEGFARCADGQAELTAGQVEAIRGILNRVLPQ